MKRGRDQAVNYRTYGPAAAALRKGHVFRDLREAKVQVTAQSILRDAVEMNRFYSAASSGGDAAAASEQVLLHNREELALYRQKRRAEFEERVSRHGTVMGNWIQYAKWEAAQENFVRMRSVMERALPMHELDFRIWRDYAELEATHGFAEEARRVFQRGVRLLPSAVDLWLKYVLLEEAAAGGGGGEGEQRTRKAFSEWLEIKDPPACAFELFVLFEAQCHERASSSSSSSPSPSSSSSLLLASRLGMEEGSGGDVAAFTPRLLLPSSPSPLPSSVPSLVTAGGGGGGSGGVEQQQQQQQIETEKQQPAPTPQQHLFEERCRRILRAYVEVSNTPNAWLFFSDVERDVLKNPERCRKVLRTAMQVLPRHVLYGPAECRVSLALAEAHCGTGNVSEARELYQRLLSEVSDSEPGEAAAVTRRANGDESTSGSGSGGSCMEEVLARYRHFERLHAACVEDGERVCFEEARKRYNKQLASSPNEYNTALSLYALLRRESLRRPTNLEEGGGKERAHALDQEAVELLLRTVRQLPPPQDVSRSQQHAALVSELARRAIGHTRGNRQDERLAREAQVLLAVTIKQFPFERARCPQIWLDAARLEEEVFGNKEQARRLLQAGFRVTNEMELHLAQLALEERLYAVVQEGQQQQQEQEEESSALVDARREYVQRMRDIFQSAIKGDPLDGARWHRYAKWEEGGGGMHTGASTAAAEVGRARAAMLYRSCIATLTKEATRLTSVSLAQRYALLQVVDETWGRLIALERRQLRRLLRQWGRRRPSHDNNAAENNEETGGMLQDIRETSQRLHRICEEVLGDVAGGYRYEALMWSFTFRERSGDGVLSAYPPAALPDSLKPALVRLREACDAAVQCLWSEVAPAWWCWSHSTASSSSSSGSQTTLQQQQEEEKKTLIRNVFQSLVAKEREEVYRVLVTTTDQSFEATKLMKAWRECLLGPLLEEWGRYEALVGGSLEAVAAAVGGGGGGRAGGTTTTTTTDGAAQGRRRTRLFKKGS